jgi:8-amino-7-oxononanoate synthase
MERPATWQAHGAGAQPCKCGTIHPVTLSKRITDVLREARENSLLRTLRTVDRWEECRLMVQGKQLIDFSSSDYLGLAYDPEVLAFIEKKLSDHGLGTASSPLITGHTSLHSAVEGKLATIYTQEGSLLFPSGWQSNVTLLPSLFGESDVILSDERNHASLIDGARLSRARVIVYAHRDYDDLERKLIKAADIAGEDGLIGITSDTVFSIEGDAADVATLVELKGKYKAALILDAAHGLPSIGTDGESLLGFDEHLVKADAVTTSLGKYFAADIYIPGVSAPWRLRHCSRLLAGLRRTHPSSAS